jgi:hypothetical protein
MHPRKAASITLFIQRRGIKGVALRLARTRSEEWDVRARLMSATVCARCAGSAKALRSEQGHDPLIWVVALSTRSCYHAEKHNGREGSIEPVFCNGHHRVGNRRSGFNVGIGMALPSP